MQAWLGLAAELTQGWGRHFKSRPYSWRGRSLRRRQGLLACANSDQRFRSLRRRIGRLDAAITRTAIRTLKYLEEGGVPKRTGTHKLLHKNELLWPFVDETCLVRIQSRRYNQRADGRVRFVLITDGRTSPSDLELADG